MARYKCTRCGTESPHNKPCFVCGGKKDLMKGVPDFAIRKKKKKEQKIKRHMRSSLI